MSKHTIPAWRYLVFDERLALEVPGDAELEISPIDTNLIRPMNVIATPTDFGLQVREVGFWHSPEGPVRVLQIVDTEHTGIQASSAFRIDVLSSKEEK